MKKILRTCWELAFGANAAKFCFGQGVMNDYSLSYMSEEQRSTRQNLARAAQRANYRHVLTTIFALVLAIGMYAQVAVDSEFDQMLNDLLRFSVPYVTVDELKALDGACLLDTRELEEYEVSHIPNAQYIGYNKFDKNALENIPKEQTIVVYCSVGYRSEKIGERLKKMGYKNVYNLYGSIFEWVNEGNEVIDKNGTTTKVHTYNKQWSKWLEKGEKVY